MTCTTCKCAVRGTRGHRYAIQIQRPGASWTATSFCDPRSAIGTVKRDARFWDPDTWITVRDTVTSEVLYRLCGVIPDRRIGWTSTT